jgi:excisionase family DNA binding protein
MIMTVGEVAAYLRVHTTTVYRMLRHREIPAFKVGSDWRFNRDTIDKWMRERTERARPKKPELADFWPPR